MSSHMVKATAEGASHSLTRPEDKRKENSIGNSKDSSSSTNVVTQETICATKATARAK